MIHLIRYLVLIDQVSEQVRPINVVVQQPSGMPEWVKILISSAVGALFGILGNIAMEYVKPAILKRDIKIELDKELIKAAETASGVQQLLEEMEASADFKAELFLVFCQNLVLRIRSSRYEFYFAEHKALMYKLPSTSGLEDIYMVIHSFKEMAPIKSNLDKYKSALGFLVDLCNAYVEKNGLTYVVDLKLIRMLYELDTTVAD